MTHVHRALRRKATRTILATVAITATLVTTSAPVLPVSADESTPTATFEGKPIDLTDGWGEATACFVDDEGNATCYRTEEEMNENHFGGDAQLASGGMAAQATCSATLWLYSSSNYGGSVLGLITRGVIMNLSAYGFNNVTSSYKIGPCSSTFYDFNNGGAPSYPGNTSGFAQSPNMLAGWDNRVSSVYIS